MAVPFRRTSKTAKRKRRTHFKIEAPTTNACPSCGKMRLNHRVCRHCGNYDSKVIVAAAE